MPAWWRSAYLRRLAATAQCCLSQRSHYHSIIQAIPREVTGSRVSTRDRAQGRIPTVVFSQDVLQNDAADLFQSPRKYLLTTEAKQIKSLLKSVQLPFFCSTTFGLQIRAGSGSSTMLESGKVLPIKIHRDEETGKILNMVFVWADEGTQLKVDVPVVFKGEDACPGLRKGGYLNRIRTSLKYICPAEHIPSKIEVDVSNLDVGDKIYMQDVEVHPSLKLMSKVDSIPICKIGVVQPKIEEPTEA